MAGQGVPGSHSEHFFELLHPNSAEAPPPPPPPPPPAAANSISSSLPPSVDAAEDGSSVPDSPPSVPIIAPSYDFQLTHTPNSSEFSSKPEDAPSPFPSRTVFDTPSGDQHQGSSVNAARGLVYERPLDQPHVVDHVTIEAIECTIKQSTDNILQALDNVNGRLGQLETRVQGLDLTITGLKAAEGEKQDQSHCRLMKLELLMEEVHRGVQSLHGDQRVDEAKSKLCELHLDEQQYAGEITPQAMEEGWQQQPRSARENLPHPSFSESSIQLPSHLPPQYSSSLQSQQPHSPQVQGFATSQSMLPPPSPFIPSPAHQQPFPPTAQHIPSQQQQSSQQASQFPPQMSLKIPSFHSQPAPQPSPPNSYNLPIDNTSFSHTQTTPHLPSLPAPPSTYLAEPSHYVAGMHGGPQQLPMLQEGFHSHQQHSPAGSQNAYDSATGRLGSISQSYGQSPLPKPGLPVPSTYEAPGSGGYGGPLYRSAYSIPSAPSGGVGYPRLPTAQPVQHGLPAANPVSRPSMRSPVDDVIDQVCKMGFSRDHTREIVRQLTENGRAVDMNVVLDRLMNGGNSSQNARSWFNRG